MSFQSHSLCKVCDEYTGGGDFCSLAHYGEYKANKAKYDVADSPPFEEDSTPSMHVGSGRATHDELTVVDEIDAQIADMMAEEAALANAGRYTGPLRMPLETQLLPAHYTQAIKDFEKAQSLKKGTGYKTHKSPIGFIG